MKPHTKAEGPKYAFLDIMTSQLTDWKTEMETIKVQYTKDKSELDSRYLAKVHEYQKKICSFTQRMEEIRLATPDKFEWLKAAAQRAWVEVNVAVDKLNDKKTA